MTDHQNLAATNHLAQQTSPYLLQHAYNPVDWYPWSEQAWQLARARDCPILLSVGYAACHWCHVMERESFVDQAIAAQLNDNFVAIKVDREERPDIDAVYMAATQAMNEGRGGWPMTVLLTPDQRPFFAATYLPPHDAGGALGFSTLLERVAQLWREDRASLLAHATELTDFLRQSHGPKAPTLLAHDAPDQAATWPLSAVQKASEHAAARFDPNFGGFGAPPKFLATCTLQLLVRRGWQDRDTALQPLVLDTLRHMARGGLWDWVAGGFSRYSTDAAWRVPHFEKMLYDNALMASVLLAVYRASGEAQWGALARDTLDFVARELRHDNGSFLTAIDADSEGEEGLFYTWTFAEAKAALAPHGPQAAVEAWLTALGVQQDGNWEAGRNILWAVHGLADKADDAEGSAMPPAAGVALKSWAPRCRSELSWPVAQSALRAARSKRVRPATDDKVLLGHNGLMMTAFATAAASFGEPADMARAEAAADFAWTTLRRGDEGLLRTCRAGRAHTLGACEDYAYFAQGLLACYEAGGGLRHLERSTFVAGWLVDKFADECSGALFDTDHEEEPLLFRPRTGHDAATPSANAVAIDVLRRLSRHTGESSWAARAERMAEAWRQDAVHSPTHHATLLGYALDAFRPPIECIWIGSGAPLHSPLWRAAHGLYLPHALYAHGSPNEKQQRWPLLQERDDISAEKTGTLYVCVHKTCLQPVHTMDGFEAVRNQLK